MPARLPLTLAGSISCDQMLPAIDGDKGASDAAGTVADLERSKRAVVVEVNQMMHWRDRRYGIEQAPQLP